MGVGRLQIVFNAMRLDELTPESMQKEKTWSMLTTRDWEDGKEIILFKSRKKLEYNLKKQGF